MGIEFQPLRNNLIAAGMEIGDVIGATGVRPTQGGVLVEYPTGSTQAFNSVRNHPNTSFLGPNSVYREFHPSLSTPSAPTSVSPAKTQPRNNLPVPRSTLPVSQGSKFPAPVADSVKWGAGLGRAANTAGRALGWASVVPAIYDFYNDAKSYIEGVGGTVPVLGADTMAMNGDEAIANLIAQQASQQPSPPADASTVTTGLANTVAQIPQQLPEIADAQQAMNAMAGNAAPAGAVPANATPVTQGLGNIQAPSMRNIDAIRKQTQRQEATQRVVRQSLPPQMDYTMQPTVSVQPYGNGGTQFNLNKNTMMFDDPDYQRLYALRAQQAQQAQQALANTNQPVTYDQALARTRAGTTWR